MAKIAGRTFGWVQNASNTDSLKEVVRLFEFDSKTNKNLRENKIPRLVTPENGRDRFIALLSKKDKIVIPYADLKGKGHKNGSTRKNAPCTGIVQAAVHGQGGKEYVDDWSADCFLRWAISIGFIDYDRGVDSCAINELGKKYLGTADGSAEEEKILGEAFLSYPPAVRILVLLDKNTHMTKFEIGSKLGIIGEAGFTSFPQLLFLQGLQDAKTVEEKKKTRQNVEGDSDKYARMICGWLQKINWVKREPKKVTERTETAEYTDTIGQSYRITLAGKTNLKKSFGVSSSGKIDKIVFWDMLSTKPVDKDYLRNRRAAIILLLIKKKQTMSEICEHLAQYGYAENTATVLDDIESFKNIGLSVIKTNYHYKITDKITHLEIPAAGIQQKKSNISEIKDRVRGKLKYIDHKYLSLIDFSFDGNANRDFEIQTIELLTKELAFGGKHLGGSRKPDGLFFYQKNGVILDNKAYSGGYNLPISQQDEMKRYIEENQQRNTSINPNTWWTGFPDSVVNFYYLFISSSFSGNIAGKLLKLSQRANLDGAVINSENLLLLAEELKSERIQYNNCFDLFSCNEEIVIQT